MGRLVRISFLAAMALVAHAAQAQDKPANPASPHPVGHPGEWISDNDYPEAAMKVRATGFTGFLLTLDAGGTPTKCDIASSSGNAALDETTCAMMMKRARFTPGTDADGKPVPSTFRSSVKWQIPDGPPPIPAAVMLLVEYDVSAGGSVSNCHVTASGLLRSIDVERDPQNLCKHLGPFAPAVDAQGKRVKRHVAMQNSVVITD